MCFYISVFFDVPSYVPMALWFATSFIHFDVFIFLISDIFENCQCEDALFPERGVMLYFWGMSIVLSVISCWPSIYIDLVIRISYRVYMLTHEGVSPLHMRI